MESFTRLAIWLFNSKITRGFIMNRFLGGVLAVILIVASVNANEPQFGIAVGPNLSGPQGSDVPSGVGFGWGFGGGLIVSYPISEILSVRGEATFDWRSYGSDGEMTEMAISIPVMGVYHWKKWYIGLGLELGIPFGAKIELLGNSIDFKDRSAMDFGTAGGLGYMITPNLGIDIRGNIMFNNMNSKADSSVDFRPHSERISVIYFF